MMTDGHSATCASFCAHGPITCRWLKRSCAVRTVRLEPFVVLRDRKHEKHGPHKESEKDAGDEVRKDDQREACEDEPRLALALAVQQVGAAEHAEKDADEEF